MNITSDYELNGKLLFLPFKGKGTCVNTLSKKKKRIDKKYEATNSFVFSWCHLQLYHELRFEKEEKWKGAYFYNKG